MRKFIENINSRQEALDELKSWNLELDRDLLNVSRHKFFEGNRICIEVIILQFRALVSHIMWKCKSLVNPFSINPTRWSNTLKQFVGKLSTDCLSLFDHFVGLVLKGLKSSPSQLVV